MKVVQIEGDTEEQYVCSACGTIHKDAMNINNILGYEYCTDCIDFLSRIYDFSKIGIKVEKIIVRNQANS